MIPLRGYPDLPPRAPKRFLALALALAPAVLGACAATCPSFDAAAQRVVYHTSTRADTTRAEREYRTADGAVLAYVEHRAAAPAAALVYLHGIESHAGWFDAAADGLCARGFDVYCLDRRGSGLNRENRGFRSGHVGRAETLIADIRAFVQPLRERYEHVFLVGLSWGGKLAPVYALHHPDDVDGLVLITPGIAARVDVSFLAKLGIFLGTLVHPKASFRTPIEPEMFTQTPETLERIRADPLRLHCATARFFWESRRLDRYLARHVEQNDLPILLFLAGEDRIIDNEAVVALLARGARAPLDVVTYEDQTHSIQFDATERLVTDTTAWLERWMAEARPSREHHRDRTLHAHPSSR